MVRFRIALVCLCIIVSGAEAIGEKVNINAIEETVKQLGPPARFEFTDNPMSEVLDYCSTARDLHFRIDSDDILTERVSINIEWAPFGECLRQLLAEHECEMSIMPDGRVLIRRTPAAVIAMRAYLTASQKSSSVMPWREKAQLMTEHGFMEQAGNLIWFGLVQLNSKDNEEVRQALRTLFDRYQLSQLKLPSAIPPYGRNTSMEKRRAAREAAIVRNKTVIDVLSQAKGTTYLFLDELQTLLATHGLSLPALDPWQIGKQTLSDNSAFVTVDTLHGRRRSSLKLEFRRIADQWKFHQSVR